MTHLILIVEDEADLAATLAYNLEREGYRTRSAKDGASALEMARMQPRPDLILLDLMLPDMNGKDVCRSIRSEPETSEIPIVMVTARGDEIDRVIGFEVGADDYVVKPYSVRELMLRIQVILKRRRGESRSGQVSVFGSLRIDPEGQNVWLGEERIVLTALELKLLLALFARRGRVLTRDQLLRDVWDMQAERSETRTVDTHVKRLRAKLGSAGAYVETVRGIGYRFVDSPPVDTHGSEA